jgi:outer membrane protein assembly factor BamA
VAVDSRLSKQGQSGSGVRLELEGEYSLGLGRGPDGFVRYGGGLGGFLDLTGKGRVLSLSASTSFVDPVAGGQVPFTELVHLGGRGLMRGFRQGRLVDRSAAVVTLQYEWPVWAWFNGDIAVSAGNVFGEHLTDFDTKLARLSATIGMRLVGFGIPGQRFEILTGIGTDTWEDGLRVSSFRLAAGTTQGF